MSDSCDNCGFSNSLNFLLMIVALIALFGVGGTCYDRGYTDARLRCLECEDDVDACVWWPETEKN